jgi:Domain of unknown function (DUF4419)
MSTFDVSEVSIETVVLPVSSLLQALRSRLGTTVEACGSNLPVCVAQSSPDDEAPPHHPFVAAVHSAFAHHYPLTLSPDDVWLCIAQGVAIHMEVNGEALRERFVRHEGKVRIEIRRDSFVKGSPHNDWPGCFSEFSDRIAQYVGKKRDLVVADFSTTGPVEKAASEIVLMSVMRHYFDYLTMTLCGIPRVTLLGTLDDWRSIRRRTEALAEFDLGWWTESLLPVLDQIVAAAAGRPKRAFWKSFYKWKTSSGGPYVSGWINTLFPYLQPIAEGDVAGIPIANDYVSCWMDELSSTFGGGPQALDFPLGLSKVPFLWKFHGDSYPMEFVSGFVGVSQDPVDRSLRPAIGWAVCNAERAPSPG